MKRLLGGFGHSVKNIDRLLNGHAKVGESEGASGNVSCSCTGEELTKLACTCAPLAVAKNKSMGSGNVHAFSSQFSRNQVQSSERYIALYIYIYIYIYVFFCRASLWPSIRTYVLTCISGPRRCVRGIFKNVQQCCDGVFELKDI